MNNKVYSICKYYYRKECGSKCTLSKECQAWRSCNMLDNFSYDATKQALNDKACEIWEDKYKKYENTEWSDVK